MNRILPIIIIAVIAIAGGGYWIVQGNDRAAEAQTTIIADDSDISEGAVVEVAASSSEVVDMVLGDPNAPITLVEYASFTCPHCASFHNNVFKQLKADYIDTGKVKFVFREVYFDRFGLWASMVARCGGESRFFGMTDLFFKGQSDWARAGEPLAIADAIRKVGRLAGLGEEQLEACMQDKDEAQKLINWYQENAERDNVEGTPSFVINGKKHSNMSYADMKEVLDGLL